MMQSYRQVPTTDDDEFGAEHALSSFSDSAADHGRQFALKTRPQSDRDSYSDGNATHYKDNKDENEDESSDVGPFEVDLGDALDYQQQLYESLLSWKDPWAIHVFITIFLSVPMLVFASMLFYNLLGRMWPSLLFALYLSFSLWNAAALIPSEMIQSRPSIIRRLVVLAMDVWVFGILFAGIVSVLVEVFFTEPDGTMVLEWEIYSQNLLLLQWMGVLIALFKVFAEGVSFATICYARRYKHEIVDSPRLPRVCVKLLVRLEECGVSWSVTTKRQIRLVMRWIMGLSLLASLSLLGWCVNSTLVHWIKWQAPDQGSIQCDPLDETECSLPFPSFHHMVKDDTTVTGWRVDLKAAVLPPLKGKITIDPSFLNELDGFSTMAPLLFYMEGLKEAHELGNSTVRLQGQEHLEQSVTSSSLTLLLDVAAQKLVEHSAEIDYLDPDRPLVLVFPARPLDHNTHYALAVVGATDAGGNELPPTPGMASLLSGSTPHGERLSRYINLILPSLTKAAPWVPHKLEEMQLLFDFPTVSAESQLGPVRAVRDSTMSVINGDGWGGWKDHVEVVKTEEGACSKPGALLARTVHAKLDVPWFLDAYGPGQRGAFLDPKAVQSGIPTHIGTANFIVHIPCSVRASAIDGANATELRAVMEFGHGLFSSRAEAGEDYLQKMANENGYILVAMDWRGMSAFDLPIVLRTLMSAPRLFQAMRDNLIQGYAHKWALQHFVRNGLLDMPWLEFRSGGLGIGGGKGRPVPIRDGAPRPALVFYGVSQGGILGGGYSALSGSLGFIDRAVLGVPGTPFAFIMSRSRDFAVYDRVLLWNFYNNRHVRIFLSLAQMGWDPLEASGVLAEPPVEPHPRVLMQAGLGDVIVPTLAAESLARAYHAKVLPGRPRDVPGLDVANPALSNGDGTIDGRGHKKQEEYIGPYVTLTELLYEREYATLPTRDTFGDDNDVHSCVRLDGAMINQLVEFVNTGRVIDPCAEDGCRRNITDCSERLEEEEDDDRRNRRW